MSLAQDPSEILKKGQLTSDRPTSSCPHTDSILPRFAQVLVMADSPRESWISPALLEVSSCFAITSVEDVICIPVLP